MDRFFDKLGDAIKNFIDEDDKRTFGRQAPRKSSGDPDLDSAFDELDEFLKTGKEAPPQKEEPKSGYSWADDKKDDWDARFGAHKAKQQTRAGAAETEAEKLRKDFAELGVPFGASPEDCKAAYKKLLKLHHPDKHAGHEGNMKKATEKSARINAAYQRIEKWRETGRAD